MKRILVFLILISSFSFGQTFERGKELFKQNCAACHNMEKKRVGPPLQGTVAAQGREWTKEWIKNSQALIKSGDAHAVEIWNEYNQAAMPSYSYLPDEDLESLVTYLADYTKEKEERQAAAKVVAPTDTAATTVVQSQPTPIYIWILLIVCAIVAMAALVALAKGLNLIVELTTKTSTTNSFLMKKLNMTSKETDDELDTIIQTKVSEQVDKKVKTLKKDLNAKLKNFR